MTGLFVIIVVFFVIMLVVALNDRRELEEKADSSARLQQMVALKEETRSEYQDVVRAHAKASKRIVKEARK